MRSDAELIEDIIEAIENIERYVSRGRNDFDSNELIQIWIIHHIQIIGEAVRHLSDDLKDNFKDIPWTQIIGMRNILVHDYFGIDLEEVWTSATKDIHALKKNMILIKNGLKNHLK